MGGFRIFPIANPMKTEKAKTNSILFLHNSLSDHKRKRKVNFPINIKWLELMIFYRGQKPITFRSLFLESLTKRQQPPKIIALRRAEGGGPACQPSLNNISSFLFSDPTKTKQTAFELSREFSRLPTFRKISSHYIFLF